MVERGRTQVKRKGEKERDAGRVKELKKENRDCKLIVRRGQVDG